MSQAKTIPAANKDLSDIVETAVAAGSFTTLLAAAKAAGLVETLKSAGPFTVFAPSDEAFKKLPAGAIETLLKPESKTKLASILSYHVVPRVVLAVDIAGKTMKVKTVEGSELSVNAVSGVKIDNATVVTADILASNGVIHVIDAVIMPNSAK